MTAAGVHHQSKQIESMQAIDRLLCVAAHIQASASLLASHLQAIQLLRAARMMHQGRHGALLDTACPLGP